jgi:hypothetical protein
VADFAVFNRDVIGVVGAGFHGGEGMERVDKVKKVIIYPI